MSFKVTVQPSGHSFDVQPGQSVLDGALNAGIVLPYSCRNGTCSSCRGKVIDGQYDAGRAPEQLLSQEDLAAGYTLFCQAKPSSDLLIESHEIRMASDIQIRKMPSRVVGLEKVRDDVMIVRL
ncbi:MAG TPA: 2Fe-2S iron-sulfur cluster-binding protein, partial [Alcaligenes faecalis]|nr:2Fe-2S iron-sulfur cluster-binding protein [Alcaligenes faecalis]